jgi:hypothetical protein
MYSCHSGRFRLLNRSLVGTTEGLLATVIRNEPQRFVTMHIFGLSSRTLPRPKVICSGTLPATEKTPLDLSIAKAQIGPWVFEVKYFKYTLFYPNPAAQRKYPCRDTSVEIPMWGQPPSAVKV